MTLLSDDLTWRGLVNQVTDPKIFTLLNSGEVTAYIGFDPTADSLHIGHMLQLLNLRRLQLSGNTPIVLAGGATGMIGDPSFKSNERHLLDEETIRANVQGVRSQLEQFLDFSGKNAATLVNNFDWTSRIDVISFLRDVGKHFTVNQLIARESVRARLEDREQGISFTEFSYALMQANDFLHLYETKGCTLQMGASDQWGNIVSGVDLIRKVKGVQAFGLVSPLVTKSDGTKFGKTESGTIWLSPKRTSPFAFYQFLLRTADADVMQYLKYFSFLSHETIESLAHDTRDQPQMRAAQKTLAKELTVLVHGEAALASAVKASDALYSEAIYHLDAQLLEDIAQEARSATLPASEIGIPVVDALVRTGLCPSKAAARTALEQGGISLNNAKCGSVEQRVVQQDLLHNKYVMLRRGKKDYAVLSFM